MGMRLRGDGQEVGPGSREHCGPGCEAGTLFQVSGATGNVLSKIKKKLEFFVLESSP